MNIFNYYFEFIVKRILYVIFLCAFFTPFTFAENDASESIKKGCEYKMLPPGLWGGKPFENPLEQFSKNGHWVGEFTVEMANHTIAGCETRLRNYNGQLVGTTIRVKPGDTINLNLKNMLPIDHTPPPEDINTPHNFNVTNFHTHGLHVSPSGNSDNVLIAVNPQTSWKVEISIPKNHPTGTFWYHAHVHGSTALQVSSGMAGAIIIENPDDPNSLDSLPEIKAAKDQTLLLQQISYDEQGEIKSYANFGPGSWEKTKRQPTINGQIMPEIVMQPGEVRRWRLIHGGIRETFMVGVVDTDLSPTDENYQWTLNEIAVDGLAFDHIDGWKAVELQPGYRSDVLVKAPELNEGETEKVFYMLDMATTAERSLLGVAEAQQVLARIVVRGSSKNMNLPCKANEACLAMRNMPPHKNISDEELSDVKEKVVFNIGSRICPVEGEPCLPCPDPNADECKTRFMINDIPFSDKNVRTLTLGTASEWLLSSDVASHPYHIHVNPFQVTRKNPLGDDEIIWRDTVFVRQGEAPMSMRTRYERYIGKFVIHCHILDHEDQGMMQIVEIVPPGGSAHH